ncbi:MAG: quinoprotein ethanol dehydrogenase [Rhodospirillales bacterium]|nr:quinoprotein ethanol dehydrogenase [Rhodospirillales bacterium]
MRPLIAALLLGFALPATAMAQSVADLRNDAKTPGDVLTYGMGYNQQRFSPLKQINRKTVKHLVPAWSYSMASNYGEESQALVKDGVIYITSHDKTVAVDALTGKEIWKTTIEYPPETTKTVCCGIVNRGAALYEGRLYRTTLDTHVIALDMKTGKEVWNVKSSDTADGAAMTGAPIVANGVLVNGIAGAEFGVRGFLEGHDLETGKQLWRLYTVPGEGEKGSETWPNGGAKASGGSTWTTGSYDPDLDLVFWGIGNPAPWNPLDRKGDDLYTNSIIAFRPKTGEMVWHYQMSPNDPFDHDGVNALVQADLKIGGKVQKVVMQAGRNGFFYVLDRATGKLLAANNYVKVTWANGIDLKTGRPNWTIDMKSVIESASKISTWPSISGGTNWFPMSYSPLTGLAYVNTLDMGMEYQPLPIEQVQNLKTGQPHYGVKITNIYPESGNRGILKAIDPLSGKAKWQVPFKSANWAGTMATAGGLVFTGALTGEFMAFDSETGKMLWQFQTPSGIIGQPITWERNGKQYVTVTSGTGGVYVLKIPDANLAHVPPGGSLWTFKLMED